MALVATATSALPAHAAPPSRASFVVDLVSPHSQTIKHKGHVTLKFRNRIVLPGNHRKTIGHNRETCHLLTQSSARCHAVYAFPEGSIWTAGVVHFGPGKGGSRLPVTGGSGAFKGVGGRSVSHDVHNLPRVAFYLTRYAGGPP